VRLFTLAANDCIGEVNECINTNHKMLTLRQLILPILVMQCKVAHNVFRLDEGWDLVLQMFHLSQILIRTPNVQFSTSAQLLANPC